jgi:hypothetical protein
MTVQAAPNTRRPSMPKPWEEMSDTEKLEIVRADMNKAYVVLNSLIADIRDLNLKFVELSRKTTSALEEVRSHQPATL